MLSKTNGQKLKSYTLMLGGILTALTVIGGGITWLFEEKIEDYIIQVVKKNEQPSLRIDLSKKMDIDQEDVDDEISWMYDALIDLSLSDDSNHNKWTSYLEEKSKWRAVGYFVSIGDKTVIKYHHQNGRDYDAWVEPATGILYYVKDGFKYY